MAVLETQRADVIRHFFHQEVSLNVIERTARRVCRRRFFRSPAPVSFAAVYSIYCTTAVSGAIVWIK